MPFMGSDDEDDLPEWVIVSAEKRKQEEKKAKPPTRRGNRVIEDSSDDDSDVGVMKAQIKSAKAEEAVPSRKGEDSIPHASAHATPASIPASQRRQKERGKPSTTKKPEVMLIQDEDLDSPLGQGGERMQHEAAAYHGTGTQAQAAPSSQFQPKGDLTLMLPDKLPGNKILVELHAASEHTRGTMDLAGDAGSVGRIVISKGSAAGDGPSFKIDLKGTLFDAHVLPLNGTAMILNIGVDQAKVEAVMHDFVRLKEDPTTLVFENGDGMDFGYGSDDEGHDLPGVEGQVKEGEEGGKKQKKKASMAMERKRPASANGAVKKKASKPRAKVKMAAKAKPKAPKAKGMAKGPAATKNTSTKRKGDTPKAPAAVARKKKAAASESEDMSMDVSESEEEEEEEESSSE